MKIGVCLSGDEILENAEGKTTGEKLYLKDRYMHEKGFDYSETNVNTLMSMTEEDLAFLEEKKAQGDFTVETANGFIPSTFHIVENGREESLCAYVDEALKRANRLGIEYIVFGSGAARRVENVDCIEGIAQIGEFLKMVDETAQKYQGTQIVIEPLNHNETNVFYTVRSSDIIRRELNLKMVQLLADSYHVFLEEESLEDLEIYKENLKHVHIAEAPDRKAPGKHGGDYLKEFSKALKSSGYQGRVSCECRWEDVKEEIDGVYTFMNEYFR